MSALRPEGGVHTLVCVLRGEFWTVQLLGGVTCQQSSHCKTELWTDNQTFWSDYRLTSTAPRSCSRFKSRHYSSPLTIINIACILCWSKAISDRIRKTRKTASKQTVFPAQAARLDWQHPAQQQGQVRHTLAGEVPTTKETTMKRLASGGNCRRPSIL